MGKGTSTSTQTQTSQGSPWAPAGDTLTSILGGIKGLLPQAGLGDAQSGALGQLAQNGAAATPFGEQSLGAARGLMAGGRAQANDGAISANFDTYRRGLSPITNGSASGTTSIQPQLDTLMSDVRQSIGGQWAAAGRDGSPGEAQAIARGFAQGAAPIVAAQHNQDVSNIMNANAALYGAGNTTTGLLNASNAAANANALTGIEAAQGGLGLLNYAPNAILAAENQRFGTPAGNLQTLLGSVLPAAQAFGTTTANASGSQTLSQLQQYALAAQALGNLVPKNPITFGA